MVSKSSKLFLLALVAAGAGCNRAPAPADAASTAPGAATAEAPTTAAEAPAAAVAAAAPAIERIVDGSLVGTKLSFFERFSGLPTYATVEQSEYEVGGCQVSALTDGETVHAIRISNRSGCSAVLPGFSGSVRLDGGLTFAAFERAFAEANYKAPCTGRFCGNAFEPYVEAIVTGYHANGFVDHVASAYYIGDVSDADRAWEAAMQAEAGDVFLENLGYNCDRRFDPAARAAFSAVKVESVTFGRDIDTLQCIDAVPAG